MASAPLVVPDWDAVTALADLLESLIPRPVVQSVFVAPWGDWVLVAVMRDLDRTGAFPVYRELDHAVEAETVEAELVSHVQLLDADDPGAAALLSASPGPHISSGEPPRTLDLTLSGLPEFSGALVRRDSHALRVLNHRRLEAELLAELQLSGYPVLFGVEAEGDWRTDLALEVDSGKYVAVEAVISDRKNIRTRIVRAAGVANLTGRAVVFVVGTLGGDDVVSHDWHGGVGVVPVFPLVWDGDSSRRDLDDAVSAAAAWTTRGG